MLAVGISELPQIFVLFSVWWWLLILGSSALMMWCLDANRGAWATATAVGTIVAMIIFGEHEFPGWVLHHPKSFIPIILVYFALGALWGVGKWYLFTNKRREKYDDAKIAWLTQRGIGEKEIPEHLKNEWKQFLLSQSEWTVQVPDPRPEDEPGSTRYSGFRGEPRTKAVLRIKPYAREHKAQIIVWMTYWPWSLLWALLDDIVRHVFKQIQRWLNETMDKIATYVFRGVDKDLPAENPPSGPTGVQGNPGQAGPPPAPAPQPALAERS